MHQLEIKLIQHTPIIHFQHNQYGATLRASEVKPKLDKYIFKNLSPSQKDEGLKNGWIITNNNRNWLNYKMIIISSNQTDEYLFTSDISNEEESAIRGADINVINDSPFFAQREVDKTIKTKDEWDKISKKGLFQTNLTIKILVCSDTLKSLLMMHIPPFFVIHNFGNRQDKGFGSYLSKSISIDGSVVCQNEPNKDEIKEILKAEFSFVFKKELTIENNDNRFVAIFQTIKDDYQKLKSGKSTTNSELYKFLREGDSDGTMRMEDHYFKAEIERLLRQRNNNYSIEKKEVSNNNLNNHLNYIYARALLGLAEQFEYGLYLRNNTNSDGIRKKAEDATIVVKVLKSNDLQRFQSPLCFKVINNILYIVGNSVPQEICGKNIQFEYSLKKNNDSSLTQLGEGSLNTPSNFNLMNFMDQAMDSLGYTKI